MTKKKLTLMSMAELSAIVRSPTIDETTKTLALDELHQRESALYKPKGSATFGLSVQFSRFNYATS